MKARVHVTLKNGVLDPQGKAIGHSLNRLGFPEVGDVRQGKFIELELAETDMAKAKARLDEMMSLALRINDFLLGLFLGVGLKLVDFKLEFGRLYENDEMRIVLADEISPDNCRLWDVKTNEKLDKDRFRRDLGNVEEAYQEVARRLGIFPEGGPRDMKGPSTMQ